MVHHRSKMHTEMAASFAGFPEIQKFRAKIFRSSCVDKRFEFRIEL